MVIEDSPAFSYRGVMLDVSRHFIPKEDVKRHIDLLAFHKLNILHWHLTDDQGWRIEIKKYPKLTTVGGYRKKTIVDICGTILLNGIPNAMVDFIHRKISKKWWRMPRSVLWKLFLR